MGKIELTAEFDMDRLIRQLSVTQLEAFSAAILADLQRRKSQDPQQRQLALLEALNNCVWPEEKRESLEKLLQLRNEATLSEAQQTKLEQLIEEEEWLRVERMRLLHEMAQLEGVGLEELMTRLGIKLG